MEKNSTFGPGAAYNDDLETNLLNTKTGYITIFPEKKSDFFNWLHNHPEKWQWKYPSFVPDENSYAPRPLFGQYLQHSFATLISYGVKKNVKIIPVNAEVVDLKKMRDSYSVITACNITIRSDYVFLMCGTLENKKQDTPKMKKGVISNPYPVSKLTSHFNREASVAIVGSRLSAIDTVIALKESGHVGTIDMFSRSGFFPSVRGTQGRYTPKHLTTEKLNNIRLAKGCLNLSDLSSLVVKDIDQYHIENPDHPREPLAIPSPAECLSTFLKKEIALAEKPRGWQAVLYSTNVIIDKMWNSLDNNEQERFKNNFLSTFLSYRVSIPMENAVKILSYLNDESLRFFSGPISISYNDSGKPEILNDATLDKTAYDHVVIATGSPKSYKNSNSQLLASLEERGSISPHPFGGINVDETTYNIIDRNNIADEKVYAIGEITSGKFFFTSALDIICRHAENCANSFYEAQNFSEKRKLSKVY
ncbi:FAD/NAD(P)-binding protein [Halomonas sp. McH1-25]|nr:FAD/NAD(P)-binding protein [Halomonas sp. McH1-25]MCP1343149.1 FAD/NAD(P)-binding protein [Halomonas sp. FL8]MCP1360960.1 FAD/NAD(P)-binding protein [Halomonas sp. BBD45]MCP1364075.1 FAD/NAD(P)-binding protein [Halomonas sp. BBD48]